MHKISNEYDFLVAQSELETDKAREVLKKARDDGDYWKEKMAAKLVDFCVEQERAMRLYAEAKTDYPELGDLMDSRWPHLRGLAETARERFATGPATE